MKRPLTDDDEFVAITQAVVEELGFESIINYWNDYNPKRKPKGLIAVLGVSVNKRRQLPIARLEISVNPPQWTTMAVVYDDGGWSFRSGPGERAEIDVYDPESFEQLREALTKRARIQLGDPDFVPGRDGSHTDCGGVA